MNSYVSQLMEMTKGILLHIFENHQVLYSYYLFRIINI